MAENYFCILSCATVLDGYIGKIPNVLMLAGLLNGCFWQLLRAGPAGLLQAATAVLALLCFTYPLYRLRGLGAGDIKLFCVIGSYLGLMDAAKIVLASFFFGAVLGIIHRIFHKEERKFCYSPAILLGSLTYWIGLI